MGTQAKDVDISTYDVDPSHSQVQFKVRHLGFSKVVGGFEEFGGQFSVDPDNLETLEAEAAIEAASINTGDEERDAHLRSEDFFAVDEHPQITFESTGVEDVSGDSLTLKGELTIRGITEPVELEGSYLGEAKDPWGGERVAFEASGEVNRKKFGLNWNKVLESGGLLVGDKIELSLDVQGVKQEE